MDAASASQPVPQVRQGQPPAEAPEEPVALAAPWQQVEVPVAQLAAPGF